MKYHWVFCIIKKIFFSEYNIKSELLLGIFSGYDKRMLEITIDNCYKYDLETVNDPNNRQYFWINRRDLEIETKHNWQIYIKTYRLKNIEKN